jgi:hypothetical protein
MPRATREREGGDALAVAGALDRTAVNDDLLFAKDLDPLRLERHVLMTIPDGDHGVHAGVYAKVLRESCNYVIEITSTLPGFGLRAIQETLQREGEIANLVKQVLEAMPLSRGAGAGDESDEAFESQYRQNIARELDRLQLFGITTERVSPRYGLSVAYITLSAAQSAAESPEDDEDENGSINSLPVDEALAGSQRVLVRGEAGSGKTTLLQWLAVQGARDTFTGALAPWNGAVPFFIQLRRWVGKDLPQPEQWLAHIASAVRGAMPNGWVHRQLQNGALVLIDGVDELPDSDRARVREWLQGLIANAESSRFIVTSRPAAAEEGWLREEGFDDSQLQPMEPQQIDALIDQWHGAAHKQTTDEDILANLDDYADSLKRVIESDRAIRNLAATPLLCAMLCLLNVDRRTKIPKDRMALYRIALETLARRESERETDWASVLDLTELQRDLAPEELAYWLIRNDRSDVKRAEAEGVVADKLPQLAARKKQVVQYLLERSGLLREPVVDRIDFIHRTFQEYLAAKRTIAAHDIGILLSHAHQPTWREVVILATGHASDGCEAILKGLLGRADREPKHRHYLSLLAVSCLETATAFSDEIRKTIQQRLAELVPPRNISEGKALAAAGDLAVPHLSGHTAEGARVVAACVRALSMIGGDTAFAAIRRYSKDRRQTVIEELMRAKDSFDLPAYARDVLSNVYRLRSISVQTVEMLDALQHLKNLNRVSIMNIQEPLDLSSLRALPSLTAIGIHHCPRLNDLTPLGGLTNLQELTLSDCMALADVSPLTSFDKLNQLTLIRCSGLARLEPLASLKALVKLNFIRCAAINDLIPLANLKALRTLTLFDCTGIRDLAPLASLRGLRSLTVHGCPAIADISPLASLSALENLVLSECEGVKSLAPLVPLTGAEILITEEGPLLKQHPQI